MNESVRTRRVDDELHVTLARVRHLDHVVLDGLERAMDVAEAADGLTAVVFENDAADFLVGVDATWVVARMEDDDLPAIRDFVVRGQRWLRRLDHTRLRTIARVRGWATGAGAEWISACDQVEIADDARIGLPETGLGIHPALGGTQRLPRRLGLAAARFMVLTGVYVDAIAARAWGLGEGERAARVDHAPLHGTAPRDPRLDAFGERSLEEILDGPRAGDAPSVRRAIHRVTRRAPVATHVADTLLWMSRDRSLEDGLACEIEELATVYATEAAMVGMRASAHGRRAARFRDR